MVNQAPAVTRLYATGPNRHMENIKAITLYIIAKDWKNYIFRLMTRYIIPIYIAIVYFVLALLFYVLSNTYVYSNIRAKFSSSNKNLEGITKTIYIYRTLALVDDNQSIWHKVFWILAVYEHMKIYLLFDQLFANTKHCAIHTFEYLSIFTR